MSQRFTKHVELTKQIIAACYEVSKLQVALLVNFGDVSVQIRRFEAPS